MIASVLLEASRLEKQGRWDEAIDLLIAENRRGCSPDVEIRLRDLRQRSWRHLDKSCRNPLGNTLAKALSVGQSGLPESSVQDLAAESVQAAIKSYGCLLVPGLVSPDEAAGLVDVVHESLLHLSESGQGSSWYNRLTPDKVTNERFGGSRLGKTRKFVCDGEGSLLADAPRALFELLEIYGHLGIRDVAEKYLGTRPSFSANKCTLRRVTRGAIGGWHQDGAFLGDNICALNLWLVLSPCGVDAPGLDIVPTRFNTIVETGTQGAYFDWTVGHAVAAELAGQEGIIRPVFNPGDLLIFDEMLLHRTAVSDTMTQPRYAIEFWCFSSSAFPKSHIPLIW